MRIKHKAKAAIDKVGDTAETVENVARGVKKVARTTSDYIGNNKHRATRSKRPSGTIVRDRNSALPDSGARAFVDPLSEDKQWVSVPVRLSPAATTSTTTAYTRFDTYVFPAYELACIQSVKYDVSSFFTVTNFRDYINTVTDLLRAYYFIAYQRAYMMDGSTMSNAVGVRTYTALNAQTETALRTTRFFINNLWFPPKLHEFIKWFSAIYATGRTPNSHILQFSDDDGIVANTDAGVEAYLQTKVAAVTTTNKRISGVVGKILPNWRLNVPTYADLPSNASLDYNWLSIWSNQGYFNPSIINPVDSTKLMLYNDNPNIAVTACATVYDSVQAQWEPGLLLPSLTLPQTYSLNQTTGAFAAVLDSNQMLLGSKLYNRSQPVAAGTFLNKSLVTDGAVTVSMDIVDFEMDTTEMLKYWFDTNMVSSTNVPLLLKRS